MESTGISYSNTEVDVIGNGTNAAAQLIERVRSQEATIGVVGLGYVGLPLAVEYADRGFRTVGIDLDESRVSKINSEENYIDDVDNADVRNHVQKNHLEAHSDFSVADDVDVFFVCVPTPVTETDEPDTSYLKSAIRSIAGHLRAGQLIIVKSTTYPSTTEEVLLPILREEAEPDGLKVGRDFFLAFSPERVDPGNEDHTMSNTPVVVGGISELCTKVATLVLKKIVEEVYQVSNTRIAEMEKLLENIFRSVNIALVNELAQLCERIGDVSIWEVVDAAATKPFGFMPFYPGPGTGGHCIPIDPYYLSWLAGKYDFETSFITLSASVNEEMPLHVAQSVIEAVAREPVRLSEAKVLMLGVAFKGEVGDTRHSPASSIVERLMEKGIDNIRYHDPYVSHYSVTGPGGMQREIPSVSLDSDTISEFDVVVITTDHNCYDTQLVAEQSSRIIDTRNALSEIEEDRLREKIDLLGFG